MMRSMRYLTMMKEMMIKELVLNGKGGIRKKRNNRTLLSSVP